MKILIVNQHFLDVVGGSEIQCHLLAGYLARAGHDTTYLAVDGKQIHYDVPYTVVPGRLCWEDIRRIVHQCAPDVVYWRFNKRKFLPSVLMFKLLRKRVVFAISHINDVLKWSHKVRFDASDWRGKCRQYYESLRPSLSSRVNHLGYYWVDGVIAQLNQQNGYLSKKKTEVIPNSVAPSAVPFRWKKPFVLWASSIKEAKNPELFIKLATHLRDKGVDFLMVGKIVNSSYRQILKDAESSGNFHYLGVKSYQELNGMLRESLVLAHTCEPEGFPNVFIQAWTQETPVVSLYYDPDGMIREKNLGYCSGRFELFVTDVEQMISNDLQRLEMGRRAKEFALQMFALERNGKRIVDFLQEICRS